MQTRQSYTKRSGVKALKNRIPREKTLELYGPFEYQEQFHSMGNRFRVCSWGRQIGKSTAALNDLLDHAWKQPEGTLWYIMPTYDQAKVQYRRLVGMLWNCRDIIAKKNQTELRVKLINNSQIVFKSGDRPDNLRTETLTEVVLDEVRNLPRDLWSMVIRPMLARYNGRATFISTPNGFDHFYDLADRAMKDSRQEWGYMHFPCTKSPIWTPTEIESARREMSEDEFAQEIMAEFRDVHTGKVYVSYGSWNLKNNCPWSDNALWVPHLPVIASLDFNVSPMSWTLGQNRADEFYWFDEIRMKSTNTFEASELLAFKIKEMKTKGFKADPNVTLIGDSSGEARNTKSAGKTDYDIIGDTLSRHGISWNNLTPSSNPPVKDRINNVNSKLKSSDGTIKMWLHPIACNYLKRDLERVSWRGGASGAMLDKTSDPDLTHSSDGVGYAISVLAPLQISGSVGKLRMIRRW
jgi:hypothetical protein